MSHSERFVDTGRTTVFYQGVEAGRDEVLADLMKLTDRFNRGESDSNMVMYLYRFIEEYRKSARTHENQPNPRFADTKILDFRTNAQNDQA